MGLGTGEGEVERDPLDIMIFEEELKHPLLNVKLNCKEFVFMVEPVFYKDVNARKIHLAAVFWFLVYEELPPSFVYNPISRYGPELFDWVMARGVKPKEPEDSAEEFEGEDGKKKRRAGSDDDTGASAVAASVKPDAKGPGELGKTETEKTVEDILAEADAEPQAVVDKKLTRKAYLRIQHWDEHGHSLHLEFQKGLAQRWGHVGKALIALDSQYEAFRLNYKEFHTLCLEIQYPSNPRTLFNFLDVDASGMLRLDVIDVGDQCSIFLALYRAKRSPSR